MAKEFNYEAAKNGAPVQTRDGRKARIICWDRKCDDYPIVTLVTDEGGIETCFSYDTNGNICGGNCKAYHLVMAPTKHEGWVNIFRREDGTIAAGDCYASKECAKDDIAHPKTLNILGLTYVATVKIEWTE